MQHEHDKGFDDFCDSYAAEMEKALCFGAKDHDFFIRAKTQCLLRLAQKNIGPPASLTALDLGCGLGMAESLLAPRFKSIIGVDISEKILEKARQITPMGDFILYDGHTIPVPSGAFDLAFAMNVFHHVPLTNRGPLLEEMKRIVKPGGWTVVFEHNPYNPLTMKVVKSCVFDRNACLLTCAEAVQNMQVAGFTRVCSGYILFLPFWIQVSAWMDRILKWLPLGAQYFVMGRRPC